MSVDKQAEPFEVQMKSVLNILQYKDVPVQEFLDKALDEAILLTGSKYGYIYHYVEERKEFVLNTWSRDVMDACAVMNPQTCYELDKTGIWGEAVRQRKPIIVNNFQAAHPLKKGYPQGHVELLKYMTLPVFHEDKIVGVVGVANKSSDYNDQDVLYLQLLMDTVWKIVALKESLEREKHLNLFLAAIRSINQLMVQAKDSKSLLKLTSESLSKIAISKYAWLALVDADNHPSEYTAVDGIPGAPEFYELMQRGQMPACANRALLHDKPVLIKHEEKHCVECPFFQQTRDFDSVSIAIRNGNQIFGVFTIALPATSVAKAVLIDVIADLAADLGFAFHKLLLQEQNDKAQKKLIERQKEMTCALAISQEMQKDLSVEDFVARLCLHVQNGMQFPESTVVKVFGSLEEVESQLAKMPNHLLAEVESPIKKYSYLAVFYPGNLEFIQPEEQLLVNNAALLCGQWLKRQYDREMLRQNEEHLRITLNSIGDGVIATNMDRKITWMNPVAEQLTAWQMGDALGLDVEQVLQLQHAITGEKVPNPVHEVLQTNKIVALSNHTVLVNRKNERLQISDTAAPIRDKDGNTIGAILVFSDVTEIYQQREALRLSEKRFKLFFDTAPEAVSITKWSNGEYVDVNPGFERISGYRRDELVGKTALEVKIWVDPEERKRLVNLLEKSGIVRNMEASFRAKSGAMIHGLMSANVISFNEEQLIILIVRDITEQEAIIAANRKLSSSLNQLPLSVIMTDTNFKIEFTNQFTTQYTQYKENELLGHNIRMLYHGDFNAQMLGDNIWPELKKGGVFRGEAQLMGKSGESVWVSTSISPFFDQTGKLLNYIFVNENIEKERAFTQELIAAKEKAEKSDQLKSAFLNNISHEIRTPLNSILGFGELFLDEFQVSLEDRKKYYGMMRKSSERLMDTITDYMDISLITSGNMSASKMEADINKLLSQLRDKFLIFCDDVPVELMLEVPENKMLTLETDPELLRKAIDHLLDNAFKFTPRGKISFGYQLAEGEVCFFVEDTGLGIGPSAKKMIFDIFVQENSATTRGHEGSGIGLSIVSGLVNLLGGKIDFQSEKNQGSRFEIRLPLTEKSAGELFQQGEKVNDQPIILVAEDEDTNFFVLEMYLRKYNSVKIMRAYNGREAVEACQNCKDIALVLMDIKMPLMTGIQATKEIKTFRPNLPIMAITAYAVSGDEFKLRKEGFDEYLPKPLQKNELYRKINFFMNSSS